MRISDWSSDVCSSDLWAQSPDDRAALQEIKVVFHTLTGAALMAQCPAIGHVARALQKRIEQCIAESIAPSAAAFGELGNFCEVIYQQLDEYREDRKSTRLNSSH